VTHSVNDDSDNDDDYDDDDNDDDSNNNNLTPCAQSRDIAYSTSEAQ